MKKLNKNKKFKSYIKNNFKEIKDDKNKFIYYLTNLNYMVEDLYNILFIQFKTPWSASKYEKRLARLIYFSFLNEINKHKVSIVSLKKIILYFKHFISQLKRLNFKKVEIMTLKKVIKKLKIINNKIIKSKNENEISNLIEFNEKATFYSLEVIKIINAIITQMKGTKKMKENILYQLDIV